MQGYPNLLYFRRICIFSKSFFWEVKTLYQLVNELIFMRTESISIQPSQPTTLQCFGRAQCMGEFSIMFVSPLGWWNKIPGSQDLYGCWTTTAHVHGDLFDLCPLGRCLLISVVLLLHHPFFTLPSTMPMHPTWVSFHFALRLRIMSPKSRRHVEDPKTALQNIGSFALTLEGRMADP